MKNIDDFKIVGTFSKEIVDALSLDIPVGTKIWLSSQTIEHIKESHPQEFENFIDTIEGVIEHPDYIGFSKTKNTVDFIRSDKIRLCVPVRPSADGIYFVRSLFKLHKPYFERLKRNRAIIPFDIAPDL